MVKVVAHVQIDTELLGGFFANLEESTPSNQLPESFTATFGVSAYVNVFSGETDTFGYANGYPINGTIDSINAYLFGDIALEIDGANTRISKAYQYMQQSSAEVLVDFFKGSDTIVGSIYDDTINGYDGRDELDGGAGKDSLRGSFDKDTFVIDRRGSANVDHIKDFGYKGVRDEIDFDGPAFRKLGPSVTGSEFETVTRAELNRGRFDKNDYLLYEKKTGKLYYDADGYGDRGQNPQVLAIFDNKFALKFSDFDV